MKSSLPECIRSIPPPALSLVFLAVLSCLAPAAARGQAILDAAAYTFADTDPAIAAKGIAFEPVLMVFFKPADPKPAFDTVTIRAWHDDGAQFSFSVTWTQPLALKNGWARVSGVLNSTRPVVRVEIWSSSTVDRKNAAVLK